MNFAELVVEATTEPFPAPLMVTVSLVSRVTVLEPDDGRTIWPKTMSWVLDRVVGDSTVRVALAVAWTLPEARAPEAATVAPRPAMAAMR